MGQRELNKVDQPREGSAYDPPDIPIDVLHEDHEVLVVSKPPGLLSVPGRGEHLADCLLTRVQVVFPHALLVHRLDRDTSGVMLFALSPHAQRHLGLQFEKRQIKKSYIARVAGEVSEKAGLIDLPLAVDWPNRPKQMVDYEHGRPAVTEWRRLKVSPSESRLRLFPKTGRSHQLRVHCLAIGHPILGDPFYATEPVRQADRLMLHSETVRFRHPDGGRSLTFRDKAPF